MGQVWARAMALVAVVSLLAGCGSEPEAKPTGDTNFLEPTKPTQGLGALSGVVVDAAIVPLAGANVSLDDGKAMQLTDASGRFLFNDLVPGPHFVTVTLAGFFEVQSSADVAQGDTVTMRVQLRSDPTPVSYHTTLAYDWYDEAGVTLVDFTVDLVSELFLGGAVPVLCDVCRFEFITDTPAAGMTIEAYWEDSIADPLKATEFFWTIRDLGEGGDYRDGYFYSGNATNVDMEAFGNSTHFSVTMTGEEEWITYHQKAQLYLTVWYLTPPPEGWSFIAGDR